MANPYYLVSAGPKQLGRIADYARKLTGSRQGDPVIAVGTHRIVLMPVAVGRMLDDHPGQSMAQILEAMKAGGAWPISADRLKELLAARDAGELNVARMSTEPDDLVIDDHDWHVSLTRLVDAWKLVGGPDGINWKDIRVGQIDTGFREHPCLGWQSGKSPFVLTEYDRNFFPKDFTADFGVPVGNENSAEDPLLGGMSDGHGTRTASVLAGYDVSREGRDGGKLKGFFGAAPGVPHIPVRISDSIIINHVQEALAEAIEHLVRHGCQVITLSMGMALTYVTGRLKGALDYAYDQGVIFVAAAGNVWDPVVAPARLNRTIAVGGCTPAMIPWLGSSFGPEVDICAPAWPVRRGSVDRKGRFSYDHGDGTSFATPQVAGTAALWLLHRSDQIAKQYPQKWQRVEAFKRILTLTAQPGVEWNRSLYGAGILDAAAVLSADLPDKGVLEKDHPA